MDINWVISTTCTKQNNKHEFLFKKKKKSVFQVSTENPFNLAWR